MTIQTTLQPGRLKAQRHFRCLQWAALCVVAATLVGCGPQSRAKEAVRKGLIDPDSAKFSDLRDGKTKGDVCGFVNAKNRMGGFVGDTPFVYRGLTDRAVMVQPPDTNDFRMVWLGIQTNSDFMDRLAEVRTKCESADQWREYCGPTVTTHRLCSNISGNGKGVYDALKREFQ